MSPECAFRQSDRMPLDRPVSWARCKAFCGVAQGEFGFLLLVIAVNYVTISYGVCKKTVDLLQFWGLSHFRLEKDGYDVPDDFELD